MNRYEFTNEQAERFIKISKRYGTIIAIVIGIFIVSYAGLKLFAKYVWMDTLGFERVYVTILSSKITLAIGGFLLFFLLSFITFIWIRRNYLHHFNYRQLPPVLFHAKPAYFIMVGAAFVIGLIGSVAVQGLGWETALKFLNYEKFGVSDPYFQMDISFYLFVLPFIQFLLYTLLNLFIVILLIQMGAYSVFHMYRLSRRAQIHLATTSLLLGIVLAGIHFIGRYETMLTNKVNFAQQSVLYGLSYTDKLINLPKAYVLAAIAIIAAIWLAIALFKSRIKTAVIPIIVYVSVFVIAQIASIVVQSVVVSPSEFSREQPYLEHNLNFTRMAYGLDEIKVENHPGDGTLTEEMVDRNALTVDNIRLNDARPLLHIYNQLQTFRSYYQFNDMDIDRYKVDGKYEQVFIGARELSTKDLTDQAKTWENRKLRYTHGYGVAMSHVNKVTKQGQPEYMLKNIPVEGSIEVTRPQIYFGEEDYPNVIVNTNVEEFDYPIEEENATTRFSADTGIRLSGFNRFLFAFDEGSIRMLTSKALTDESQLLATRNIKERVERIAPFLSYDEDPYIFIREDGTLAWIIDAYVTAERFPYSEPYEKNTNYIRNSVKVVVDAYTGEVDFYIVDEEDPLIQTYANMFPTLFTSDIPEDVYEHFRYPIDLFKIQTAMYGTYHMSNLEVFYNREDYWEFATEKLADTDIRMEPYYITMKLPESEHEEFILMQPYTPKNRQNMISWIGVRNDGDHYGEMFVYRFPKQRNIYGPQQIENRINQHSFISQQLNLWSQGGSEVTRGNLLVIPIEDTLLYVEPIYIESSNETALPEVQRVIMAYEDFIVMEETFEESLEKILTFIKTGEKADDEQLPDDPDMHPDDPEALPDDSDFLNAPEMLAEISDLFTEYQEALALGQWSRAGEIMEEIEAKLNQIQ